MIDEANADNVRELNQQRRESAVRAVLGRIEGRLSQDVIDELKSNLGVSRATAYRMIKSFRTCGAIVAPSTRPVGRPKGSRVLDPRRETLILEAIQTFYLRAPRPKFNELVREIERRCRDENLPTPNWRTIKTRVHDVLHLTQSGSAQ